MIKYSELIKNRRSIRDFKEQKIDNDILWGILHDACLAPSASNGQPWKFIIVQNQQIMKKISAESKKNLIYEIESDPNSKFEQYKKMLQNDDFNVFYNAPCLVLICGKKETEFFERDCTLAVACFMFAAVAKGLGTCWIGLGDKIKDSAIKKEIGLPDDQEIVASIIIGYPTSIPKPTPRNDPVILKIID